MEDVKTEVMLETTVALQFYLFIVYLHLQLPLNPSHPAEKDAFMLTSFSSHPLPIGCVCLNGAIF